MIINLKSETDLSGFCVVYEGSTRSNSTDDSTKGTSSFNKRTQPAFRGNRTPDGLDLTW